MENKANHFDEVLSSILKTIENEQKVSSEKEINDINTMNHIEQTYHSNIPETSSSDINGLFKELFTRWINSNDGKETLKETLKLVVSDILLSSEMFNDILQKEVSNQMNLLLPSVIEKYNIHAIVSDKLKDSVSSELLIQMSEKILRQILENKMNK
jgi:hypothetical protein